MPSIEVVWKYCFSTIFSLCSLHKSHFSTFFSSCGKLFQTNEEVEFHAVKSGHSNFSESTEEKKPLTEEEKLQKVSLHPSLQLSYSYPTIRKMHENNV